MTEKQTDRVVARVETMTRDEVQRVAEAVKRYYQRVKSEGHAAYLRDLELRYAGAQAHFASLQKPALRAWLEQHAVRVGRNARKASMVERAARVLVPDWREIQLLQRVPLTCRVPRMSKAARAEFEQQAPPLFQEAYEAVVNFCDSPADEAAQRCAELDQAVQDAGYLDLETLLRDVGLGTRTIKTLRRICPEEVPF